MKRTLNKAFSTFLSLAIVMTLFYFAQFNVVASECAAPSNGQVYFIRNVYSNKYLDISNGVAATQKPLVQYEFTGNTQQQFKLIAGDSGYYYIAPIQDVSLRVDIDGGNTTDGTTVKLYTINPNNVNAQQFCFTSLGNDKYKINSKLSSSQVVELQDFSDNLDTRIELWSDNGGTNQQWILEKASAPGIMNNTEYFIKNVQSNNYLSIENELDNAGQDAIGIGYTGSSAQKFSFVYQDNGKYRIDAKCSSTGKVLDITGGQVDIWPIIGGASCQSFQMIRDNSAAYGGTYCLKVGNVYVGLNLSTGKVQTYTSPGSNTRWSLEKVNKGSADIITANDWYGALYSYRNQANDEFTDSLDAFGYYADEHDTEYGSFWALLTLDTSEIWAHSYHASTDLLQFCDSDGVISNIYLASDLRPLPNNDLSNLRCFISTGCRAGGGDYATGGSMIDTIYAKGAHFALGWTDITYSSGFLGISGIEDQWSETFWEEIGNGDTILEAMQAADFNSSYSGVNRISDGLKHYQGDVYQLLGR